MDTSEIILHIAMILIIARIFGELAEYFKVPAVIGELLAGVLLGPSLFGLIAADELILLLAEIGIILLLFQIGLETDIGELVDAGTKSVIVGLAGFIIPFLMCFCLCYYWFELSLMIALMIAGTMSATSIGVTMRSLTDLGKENSKEGQIILGAAVLDDILGVLLLALLFDLSQTGTVNGGSSMQVVGFIAVFFLFAPMVAKGVSYFICRFEPKSTIPGLVPTTIVALVLLLAWVSELMGIPKLLGGFVTGLALSRRFIIPLGVALRADHRFSDSIHKQVKPIVQLFTPIFFVSIGLSVDLSEVNWSSSFFWYFSLSLTLVAIVSKVGGAMLIKEQLANKVLVGMAMVPRGEVGLVFAELGRATGLFDEQIYATVVIVIAYTTLFTPYWLRLYYRRFGHCLS